MPISTQKPILSAKPQQPQPATAQNQEGKPAAGGNLEQLERVRDLSGQKAQAAETYGKSGGKKPSKAG